MKIHTTLLSQLFTFEKTASFDSFTKAAHELNVTTGAISQQIRSLESTLGFSLFDRHSRGIKLTSQGQELRDAVTQGVATIESTLSKLSQLGHTTTEIHLKLTPSFAFKWLVPRLQSFYKQYPHITITTYAESGLVNYDNFDYDLAIDYQKIPFDNKRAQLLLAERILPVMSPDYWEQLHWPPTPSNITNHHWQKANLLHDAAVWPNSHKMAEWQDWFAKQQLSAEGQHHYFFNRTDMSMAAAEAGVGIALARCALITNELDNKRLISPFSPIAADAGYYLIEHKTSAATRCFKEWLLNQLH
jgi:LysR family glycine cleavage system transcriptional activator